MQSDGTSHQAQVLSGGENSSRHLNQRSKKQAGMTNIGALQKQHGQQTSRILGGQAETLTSSLAGGVKLQSSAENMSGGEINNNSNPLQLLHHSTVASPQERINPMASTLNQNNGS